MSGHSTARLSPGATKDLEELRSKLKDLGGLEGVPTSLLIGVALRAWLSIVGDPDPESRDWAVSFLKDGIEEARTLKKESSTARGRALSQRMKDAMKLVSESTKAGAKVPPRRVVRS